MNLSAKTRVDLDKATILKLRQYIKQSWHTLTRSHDHIVDAAMDEKISHPDGMPWPVYVSAKENIAEVEKILAQAVPPEKLKKIKLQELPAETEQIDDHGLLYLPGAYVVPGGRFNEMYGWDSYFIQLGLLQDQEYDLAKSMVDQALYEVEHYGTVLNANRTYFLNRSQPPFLSQMVLNWYSHSQDKDWLRSTIPQLESYYYYWTVPPHLNANTGLSHYYAIGDGPAPEVIFSERDEGGRTHFDRIKDYYRTHSIVDYDLSLYYDSTGDRLTDLFYKGDRSMRESGLDPTNRFGPFSVDIIHYAPVCLNVLLYMMEQDLAQVHKHLDYPDLAQRWQEKAEERAKLIDEYLWDDDSGLYLDYNFRDQRRRYYEYATTFYPLWAGIATPDQAQQVVENLSKFEAPGGVRTSNYISGNQWDAPFGWAPFQLVAVRGLLRYGYRAEAKRIAESFISLVLNDFERCGALLEKYDLERCSGNVSEEIQFGYSTNEIGFGWTNGVVLELLAILDALEDVSPD
ncbi:MAG: trehalase family glycosidase [Cyanobacteria bacterium P01_D01_bin.56]